MPKIKEENSNDLFKELVILPVKSSEQIEEELKKFQAELKPLSELVFTEVFNINDVVVEAYPTSFTPFSEIIIGDEDHAYKGGYAFKTILDVMPENPDNNPIRKLIFESFSSANAGPLQFVKAKIPSFEYKTFFSAKGYVKREYKAEEKAIELKLLKRTFSANNHYFREDDVLRTERAVYYDFFMRK